MGAMREPHIPDGSSTGHAFGPATERKMASSESTEVSLVKPTREAAPWKKSPINLDSGFRALMLLSGLVVLGIVGLIVAELMQGSALAWQKFGIHFFFGSAWDPVGEQRHQRDGLLRLDVADPASVRAWWREPDPDGVPAVAVEHGIVPKRSDRRRQLQPGWEADWR